MRKLKAIEDVVLHCVVLVSWQLYACVYFREFGELFGRPVCTTFISTLHSLYTNSTLKHKKHTLLFTLLAYLLQQELMDFFPIILVSVQMCEVFKKSSEIIVHVL